MLSFTLLYIKHVKKFESCLWLVHFIECGYWFISNYYFLIRQIQKVYRMPISN